MLPDDTAGRPLTPGEQTAIADLERRLLLDAPAPGHRHPTVGRRGRLHLSQRRARAHSTAAVPLSALLGAACLLIVVLVAAGGGLLGAAAVLTSTVATAVVWPLLPARWGGPVRPPRHPYRRRGELGGRL